MNNADLKLHLMMAFCAFYLGFAGRNGRIILASILLITTIATLFFSAATV